MVDSAQVKFNEALVLTPLGTFTSTARDYLGSAGVGSSFGGMGVFCGIQRYTVDINITVSVEFSEDATFWYPIDSVTLIALAGSPIQMLNRVYATTTRYARVRVVNNLVTVATFPNNAVLVVTQKGIAS